MIDQCAIAAASMRCRTMADGSLRIECEIEPRYAIQAFTMFSSPGTPIALAALKVGTQLEKDQSTEPAAETTKGGPLAKWAAMRCQDVRFISWLRVLNENAAREKILEVCRIRTRAELDNNPQAAEMFDQYFRRPWAEHCKRMWRDD